MGDAADEAEEMEWIWEELKALHRLGRCEPGCPYCDPDFEPFFTFQVLDEGE